jgi:hypothetical protein
MAEELQDLLAQHEHWRRPRPPQRSSGPPMGR